MAQIVLTFNIFDEIKRKNVIKTPKNGKLLTVGKPDYLIVYQMFRMKTKNLKISQITKRLEINM